VIARGTVWERAYQQSMWGVVYFCKSNGYAIHTGWWIKKQLWRHLRGRLWRQLMRVVHVHVHSAWHHGKPSLCQRAAACR
jgi:hypothetical protein